MDYQVYLAQRRPMVEDKKHSSGAFDKAVLSLSGGALALSLIFIKQVAPSPVAGSLPFVAVAWFGFAAAAVCMSASLLTSQYAIQHQINVLDLEYQANPAKPGEAKNIWSAATQLLNWLAISLFVIGVALFASFSFMNLPVK